MVQMLCKADMQLKIEFEDSKQASIVMKALKPELNSSPSERATVELTLEKGNIMDVNIKASDATSLRAAVNSYLRWIMLSVDVINVEKALKD